MVKRHAPTTGRTRWKASFRRRELGCYFAVEQPQPLAQVHVPLQAQSSPQVQRAGLAAQPHEVV
jgi:hypothetical protein